MVSAFRISGSHGAGRWISGQSFAGTAQEICRPGEGLLQVLQHIHELLRGLIDLARIGLGIAFVPDFCIPANDKDLFILELSEKLPARQMVVAFNESLPVSQAAKQFMDML